MKEILIKFSEVCPSLNWDRFTEVNNTISAFGWIIRTDGQRDFLVLNFHKKDILEEVWFCTSSAKYGSKFAELIGGEHVDCQIIPKE